MSRTILTPFLFHGPAALSSQAAAGTVLGAEDPLQLAESLGAVQQGLIDGRPDAGELTELHQAIDRYRDAAEANDAALLSRLQRQIGDLLPRVPDALWWQGTDPYLGIRDRSIIFLRRSHSALQALADRLELYEDTPDFHTVGRMVAGLEAFVESDQLADVYVQRQVDDMATRLQQTALRALARSFGIRLPEPPTGDEASAEGPRPLPESMRRYTARWGMDTDLQDAILDMLAHAAERSVLAVLKNMSWDNQKPRVGRQWLRTYQRAMQCGHIDPTAKLRLIHLLGDGDSFGKTAPLLGPAALAELDFHLKSFWPAPLQLGRHFGHQVRINRHADDQSEQLVMRPAVLAEEGRYHDHAVLHDGHSVQLWQSKKRILDLGYEDGRVVGPPHLARLILQAAGSVASGQRSGFTLVVIAPGMTQRLRRFFFHYHPQGRILHWSRTDYRLYTCEPLHNDTVVEHTVHRTFSDATTNHYRALLEPAVHDLMVMEEEGVHAETQRLIQAKTEGVIARLPERNRKDLLPSLIAARDVALDLIGSLSPNHHLAAAVLAVYDSVQSVRLTEGRARWMIEQLNQTLSETAAWLAPSTADAPQLIDLPLPSRPRGGVQKKRPTTAKAKESRADVLPWTDDMRTFLGQIIPRRALNMRKVHNLDDFFRLGRIQLRVAHQKDILERLRDRIADYPQQAEAMEREMEDFAKGRQQTLSNQTLTHLVRIAAWATNQTLPPTESEQGSAPPQSQPVSPDSPDAAFKAAIEPIARRLAELNELVAQIPQPDAIPAGKIAREVERLDRMAAEALSLYEQLDGVEQQFRQHSDHDAVTIGRLEEQIVALEERYESLLVAYAKVREEQARQEAQVAAEQARQAATRRRQAATDELDAAIDEIDATMHEIAALMGELEAPLGAAPFKEKADQVVTRIARLRRRAEWLQNASQRAKALSQDDEKDMADRIETLQKNWATQLVTYLKQLRAREASIQWAAPVRHPISAVPLGRFFDATLSTPDEAKEILLNVSPDRFAAVNAYPEFALLARDEDIYRRFMDIFSMAAAYGPSEWYVVFKEPDGTIRTGRVLLRSQLMGRLSSPLHIKSADGIVSKVRPEQILRSHDSRQNPVHMLKRWVETPAKYGELKIRAVAEGFGLRDELIENLVFHYDRAHQADEKSYHEFIVLRIALYIQMMSLDEKSRRELFREVTHRIALPKMKKRLRAASDADGFLRSAHESYRQALAKFELQKSEAVMFFYLMFYPFIREALSPTEQAAMDEELRGRLSEQDLSQAKQQNWTQRFLIEWRREENAKFGASLPEILQSFQVLVTPKQSYLVAGKSADRAAAFVTSDARDKTKLSDVVHGAPIELPRGGWGYRMGRVEELPDGSYYRLLSTRFERLAAAGGPSRALLELLLRHNGSLLDAESRQELMTILCHQIDREPDFAVLETACVLWTIRHAAKLKKSSEFRNIFKSVKSCYSRISEGDAIYRPIPLRDLRAQYKKIVEGSKFLMVVEDTIG